MRRANIITTVILCVGITVSVFTAHAGDINSDVALDTALKHFGENYSKARNFSPGGTADRTRVIETHDAKTNGFEVQIENAYDKNVAQYSIDTNGQIVGYSYYYYRLSNDVKLDLIKTMHYGSRRGKTSALAAN